MRALLMTAMLISSAAFAQNGVWTGYVNGWVSDSAPAGTWTGYVGGWRANPRPAPMPMLDPAPRPRLSEQDRRELLYRQAVAQQAFLTQQTLAAQAREQDQERLRREADAIAAQQRLVEQQQTLIQQQQAAQAQLLAEQQQLAAERERLRVEEERRAL
ncbi:MAG: hypothetical protein ACOZQL_05020, partial [Myxococcota bacterium]